MRTKIIAIILIVFLVMSAGLYLNKIYATDIIIDKPGDYEPDGPESGTVTDKISTLLSVLLVIGIVATVISIAILGFSFILGSANEKAGIQVKMIGIIVGGIFLMAGSAIAKLIISVAETF